MEQEQPVRLTRAVKGRWSFLGCLGLPATASLLYGLAAAPHFIDHVPPLLLVAAALAVVFGLLFFVTARLSLRAQNLRHAPAGARFESGRGPIIFGLACGALLATLTLWVLVRVATRDAGSAVAWLTGMWGGMAAGVAANPLWMRRMERSLGVTYWIETPRLKGWYDRSALYYRTEVPGAELPEPEPQPLKLSRSREQQATMGRWMAVPGFLGLAYGVVTVAGFGKRPEPFFGPFAAMFGLIALYMSVAVAFTARKTFKAAQRVPAPPDAQFVPATGLKSPMLPLAAFALVLLGYVALRHAPELVGAISGVAGGFVVPSALAARLYQDREREESLAFWTPALSWTGEPRQAQARGARRGRVLYTTPLD